MNANYNYIINLLTEIANGHPQLQDVRLSFQDQRSLFHEKAKGLPVLYANVTNVRYLEYTVNWDIDIYIMDNILDNRENESSIMNNTGEIVNHIINFVKNEKFNDYRFLDIGFAQPLNNYDNNRMNGWIFRTRIETKREQCYTPIEGGVVPILCADANVIVLNSDNVEVDSGTVGSGGTGTFLAPDADAVLKNTAGTTLSTTSIASGDSEDIIAPDATARVRYRNSSGTTVTNITSIPSNNQQFFYLENTLEQLVKANGVNLRPSKTFIIEDSVITLKNTANATLSTTNVASTNNANITAPDGQAINSDASFTLSVPSGGTAPIPDSQINVNSVNKGDVVSVKTIDVNMVDEDGDTIAPIASTLVGNALELEVVNWNKLAADMFEGRVLSDSGTFESKTCLIDFLEL
jgi:hypothetical protein